MILTFFTCVINQLIGVVRYRRTFHSDRQFGSDLELSRKLI